VPYSLLVIVLMIVAFYLVAGIIRYIRQEWRSFARGVRRRLRGDSD